MDFTWVKRKDCKVLLQDSTLVVFTALIYDTIDALIHENGNKYDKSRGKTESIVDKNASY
jgi:hypothetical protein